VDQTSLIETPQLVINPLAREHGRGDFSCGVSQIDNFLKNNALKDHKQFKIRVFVATIKGSPVVVGYYTLTFIVWNDENVSSELIKSKLGKSGFATPALYLAKLGVNIANARQGIGAFLMRDAFIRSIAIAEQASIPTLTLEAISEEKALWYEKLGFERFAPGALEMVISLATLRRTLKPLQDSPAPPASPATAATPPSRTAPTAPAPSAAA
jgi:predicted N-acetyltransferase YhbS